MGGTWARELAASDQEQDSKEYIYIYTYTDTSRVAQSLHITLRPPTKKSDV